MSRVFSYVVAADGGFSPNPFHGWCTLACCKPRLRRVAHEGDLIVGLSRRCARVVYMLEVEERLTFEEYWTDSRYRNKRPKWESKRIVERCGDNIYQPDGRGGFFQVRSVHWDHERNQENLAHKRHDTSGLAVLVGRSFVYFGSAGPALPSELSFLSVARGHRSRFTMRQIAMVREFFREQHRGMQGRPTRWSESDQSWRASCGSS